MTADILIVDDEEDIRNLIKGLLEDEGYTCRTAGTSAKAFEEIAAQKPALVVQDIWLQGSEDDGLEILKKTKESHPEIPFVMISGHGTIETAVSSIKDGAYDFIEKPFKSDRLLLMIGRALETADLIKENTFLKKQVSKPVDLIGQSSYVEQLKQLVDRVASTNSRILITGEQGTGKDIVARMIHKHSDRNTAPFMVVNCATLRPENLEVELFGSASIANHPERTGVLEQVHGGTLLLDEIADMPLEIQSKLIRVLQEQKLQKIGSMDWIDVDVRILASTHKNLEDLIEKGTFRQDLYYRLNVVPVAMLPLRERKADIEGFAYSFIEELSDKSSQDLKISDKAMRVLKSYSWPGNIRQLRNTIEWMLIMFGRPENDEFDVQHLPSEISGLTSGQSEESGKPSFTDYSELSLREAREAFETEYLKAQVERFDGNISKTAQFVGMERSALHRKLKSLDITPGQSDNNANVTNIEDKQRQKEQQRA